MKNQNILKELHNNLLQVTTHPNEILRKSYILSSSSLRIKINYPWLMCIQLKFFIYIIIYP